MRPLGLRSENSGTIIIILKNYGRRRRRGVGVDCIAIKADSKGGVKGATEMKVGELKFRKPLQWCICQLLWKSASTGEFYI